MDGSSRLWAIGIGILAAVIALALAAAPATAPQHWHLLTAPLILAAYRFGKRGAIAVSGLCVVVGLWVFRAAGNAVLDPAQLSERLGGAALSPDQLSALALQLADLRQETPLLAFVRVLTGLGVAIAASIALGASVDRRERSMRLQERAVDQLRRHFSPQVVETILAQPSDGGPYATSSRKEVTVLFASLHGFTALSEQAPPDEVMGLLNEFVSAMSEEIFRQDGALEKRGGDSLMAVFGDPVWRPDHSARAMSAAFAMRRRMAALQQDWEAQGHPSIGMGIGLSSGYTVLGATGSPARTDSTVVGGAVNIAARLCELALPGQIVTTRKTYLRVQDVATAAPRERTAVKGFALSVEIMDVLGPLETGPVKTAAPVSLFTTTVGRLLSDTVVAAMLSAETGQDGASEGLTVDERNRARALVLAAGPLLAGAPAAEVAALALAAVMVRLDEPTVLVRQGEIGETFFLVVEGEMEVAAQNAVGQEQVPARLGPGDHYGEIALLFDQPRTTTVRTLGAARLMVLERERFYTILRTAPVLRGRLETVARARLDAERMK